MDYSSIEKIRLGLGISQAEFCRCIGVHKNNYTRWKSGQNQISEPISRLAMLLRDRPELSQLLKSYTVAGTKMANIEIEMLATLTEKTGTLEDMEIAAAYLLELHGVKILSHGKKLTTLDIIRFIIVGGDVQVAKALVRAAANEPALYEFVARIVVMHMGAMLSAGREVLDERLHLIRALGTNSDLHRDRKTIANFDEWVAFGAIVYEAG